MKISIIILMGVIFAIFFAFTFQSFNDFVTRESVLTSSSIFLMLILGVLLNELYLSYRERQVEAVETYFDAEDEIMNIDKIQIKNNREEKQDIHQITEDFRRHFEKPISPFDIESSK